jgi:uncharacterized oxidoreductase
VPTFSAEHLEGLTARIFQRCGAPATEAQVVAELLVKADLMGLPSHGVLRIPQYVADTRSGAIVPGVEIQVEHLKDTIIKVDGRWNFGQIVATRAAELAISAARKHGLACAAVRRCRHVGRLGAYAEMAAEHNCIGLATCSTAGEGHWVAPFGGRQGRLGTNPMSFAAPTGGFPILLDFSTSSLPEGKVRLLRDTGKELPPQSLVDREGRPSVDPHDLYDQDGQPAGAILPAGGEQGYKGYGLGLMCLVLSSVLGEPTWREQGIESHSNTMWLLAVDIEASMSTDLLRRELDAVVEYIRSSALAPGSSGVLMPGQREFESMEKYRREGIPVADGVWSQIVEVAAELQVDTGPDDQV